jgi:poly-gamma-glutamate synthesis protein (capsule biosynthesis protein)
VLKKFVFALILSVFILGIAFALPKSIGEFPLRFTKVGFINTKPKPETTMILTGDIMLGRSVMATSLGKNDPTYPFSKVAERLNGANLVFGNLENPIIEGCPTTTSGMIFCASPAMLAGLKYAGIDVVSIANNHTKNYGEEGFAETKDSLKKEGINFVDDENLVVKEINGTKFGFVGFNFVDTKPKDSDYQLIRDSKSKVDVLIVMVHWGIEYMSEPSATQKEIAHSLIDNGAGVVVGNHPHWVQSYDTIDGKPIFYSLGNFVFDQAWSEETKSGLAIRLTYEETKLKKIEEMPVYMENFAQPSWRQ